MLSLLFVFLVDGFFPFGNGSVLALDLQSQYTPLLYRFYDVITGSKNLVIDFHIGGGINLFTDTVTALLNPFNYILLLFGRSNLYLAVNLLLPLYAAAASMSSYYAMKKLIPGVKQPLYIVLGLAYGLSYYCAYQFEIINWLYIVVLFPFFFLCLDKLLKGQKSPGFVLLLAYILCNSLQLGIQLCMFTLVYSACVILKPSNDEKCSKDVCASLGLSVLSGLLLSAPVTVPTIFNLMNSARSDYNSSIASVITHHGLDNIIERLFEISSPVSWAILLFCLVASRKKLKEIYIQYKSLFLCLFVLILTVIIEPANLLWHLGSYQCFPVRYGYVVLWITLLLSGKLLSTMCGCFGCVQLDSAKSVENTPVCDSSATSKEAASVKSKLKRQMYSYISLTFTILVSIAVLLIIYKKRLAFAQAFATLDISNVCRNQALLLCLLMTLIAFAVVASLRCGIERKCSYITLITLCAVTGIAWNMSILLPQASESRQSMQSAYKEMNEKAIVNSTDKYTGHSEDNSLYPLNYALITGDYSMTAYVPSGESKAYVNAMSKLGYEAPWISVYSTGGSELSDRLLAIGGGLTGALNVTEEEYNELFKIDDYKDLLENSSPVAITFNNRKGTVSVSSDKPLSGYLLLPMAYMEGWTCKQGDVTSHLEGFLAIRLTQKSNDIVLTYKLPGLRTGLFMCLVGLGIFILLLASYLTTNKASVAFKLTSALFAIFIYVIPLLGMIIFMTCKAFGNDYSDYLNSKAAISTSEPVLLSETMSEDGLHVLIARNNIMLQKGIKISASDQENNSFRPSKIADGDNGNNSRWSSSNDRDNNEHYIQADFGKSQDISAVKIYWERTNACDYSIEYSQDATNWSIARHFDSSALSDVQTEYFEDAFNCRYIRIHVYDVNKNEEDLSLYYQNVSIQELEVYSTDCDNILIPVPELTSGTNRQVPVPEVPAGYRLSVGGIDYDNLLGDDNSIADTLSEIEINLGYTLSYQQYSWDLTGFDLLLPASDGSKAEGFPYTTVSCKEWKAQEGSFNLDESISSLSAGKENDPGASTTSENDLVSSTTNEIKATDLESNPKITIKLDDSRVFLGEEGYEIEVSADHITLVAAGEQGLAWAKNTLLKMIEEKQSSLPCGILRDYPRYAVRGFVLDVGRRPISMDTLYKILELMADKRMNTFQIHLNDNAIISSSEYDGSLEGARALYSGYRIESSVEGLTSTDGYYTSSEFADFVSTAKAMGIDIVPEIDTPAHSMAITRLYPEYGFDNPAMADELNLEKPGVLDFTTSLWAEQLEADDSAFADCDVLHLGMDEFYGDNEQYAKYISDLSKAVRKLAPDKKLRIWGSMKFKEVNTTGISKDIDVMIWNTMWDDPLTTYENGFGIINCLNNSLYIIVDNPNEALDTDYLKNEWEANKFVDGRLHETIPQWSPRMLGACYSMWNDYYCNTLTGPTEAELIDKFSEPLDTISQKLW